MTRQKRVAPNDPPPAPTPLSLDQLIAHLQTLRSQQPELADRPVELPWDPGFSYIRGRQAAVKLIRVSAGFDWDHGRVFVHTAEQVGQVPEELRRRLRLHEDALMGIALEVRRATDDPTKGTQGIQKRLDAFHDRLRALAEAVKPAEAE